MRIDADLAAVVPTWERAQVDHPIGRIPAERMVDGIAVDIDLGVADDDAGVVDAIGDAGGPGAQGTQINVIAVRIGQTRARQSG